MPKHFCGRLLADDDCQVPAVEACCMQAIRHSRRENAMTTTTTARVPQRTAPVAGAAARTQRATGSPGTSGVIAALHVEEAELATALGPDYTQYASHTPPLVPGLW
jgi:hypothetical protein